MKHDTENHTKHEIMFMVYEELTVSGELIIFSAVSQEPLHAGTKLQSRKPCQGNAKITW